MSAHMQSWNAETGEVFIQTFSAPIRAFHVKDGRLYVLTDESVGEVTIPPTQTVAEVEPLE